MYLNDNRCNTEILSKDIMSRLEPIFAEIEENGLWDNPTEETESDVDLAMVASTMNRRQKKLIPGTLMSLRSWVPIRLMRI